MIVWNPSEVAITIGNFELRWYAVFWCLGLAAAYYIVHYLYRRQGISQEKFDPLFL